MKNTYSKALFVVLVSAFSFLTGCSDKEVYVHDYVYVGENTNWSAKYEVNGTSEFSGKDYKGEHISKFKLTYKGSLSDLADVKHFEYGYEDSSGSRKRSMDQPPTIDDLVMADQKGNGAIPAEDESVKVTVKTDDKVETFELRNENNKK
ncbi:hypothetical protein SY83_19965 [Paenibacillus swuensis]|uniref:Lipoprotein n=1 Tax=Paenibacillus swuensis TaxID=1178515 RepID=A0A172TMB1_9BACL|nr:hypothetical protein [Paenibacillus swuensis]ANE48191.1 hypothetical protein SY83_19965 [Paenibacillus swuensis]